MISKRKIFFALLPSEGNQKLIKNLQSKFHNDAGRWVIPQNFHMTLCFIGFVDEKTMECLTIAAREVRSKRINLKLNIIGRFNKAKILWLGSDKKDTDLHFLHEQLIENLASCDVNLKLQEFRPHVTLARNNQKNICAPEFDAIEWLSDSFCLMESIQVPGGVSYKILEEYSLQ